MPPPLVYAFLSTGDLLSRAEFFTAGRMNFRPYECSAGLSPECSRWFDGFLAPLAPAYFAPFELFLRDDPGKPGTYP
jgi:hypothetical protein